MEEKDFFVIQFNDELGTSDPVEMHQKLGENSNVMMKDKDFYKSYDKVKEKFQKSDGSFDDAAYDKFYNESVAKLNQFTQVDEMVKGMNQPVADTQLTRDMGLTNFFNPEEVNRLTKWVDPLGRKIGTEGGDLLTDPLYSFREAAQMNKLRDQDGKEMDVTPEQFSGFLGMGAVWDTMYLAQHEKDGFDDKGRAVKKGDIKLDDTGKPFYQLYKDGDSLEDKEILSMWDVMTDEGSFFNKYNFMEGDDLEKSITGHLAKAGLQIGLLLNPTTGAWLGGAMLAQGAFDMLGTLTKVSMDVALGEDSIKNPFYQAINKGLSRSKALNTSMDDYSQQNMWSFGNLTNIAAQSVQQLYTQRGLANLLKKGVQVAKSGGFTKGDSDMVKSLTSLYMGLETSTPLYEEAKKIGASNREAAALYGASTAILSAMFKHSPIGNWVLKNLDEANILAQRTLRDQARALAPSFKNSLVNKGKELAAEGIEQVTKTRVQQFAELGTKLGDKVVEVWKKASTGSTTLAASTLEGLEEASEAAAQLALKGLYNGYRDLGMIKPVEGTEKARFQIKNIGEEIFTNAIGGVIGGAVFKLHDKMKGLEQTHQTFYNYALSDDTETLLTNLESMKASGKLASTSLSMEKSEDGNYLPANENRISQNEFVYRYMKSYLDSIETLVSEEGMPKYGELYDTHRSAFLKANDKTDVARDYVKDLVVNTGLSKTVEKQALQTFTKVAQAKARLINLTTDSDLKPTEDELSEARQNLADARQELKDLQEGRMVDTIYAKSLFLANSELSSLYGVKNTRDFLDKDKIINLNERIEEAISVNDTEMLAELIELRNKEGEKASEKLAKYRSEQFESDFEKAFTKYQEEKKSSRLLKKLAKVDTSDISKRAEFYSKGYYQGKSDLSSLEPSVEDYYRFKKLFNDKDISIEFIPEKQLLVFNGEQITPEQLKTLFSELGFSDRNLISVFNNILDNVEANSLQNILNIDPKKINSFLKEADLDSNGFNEDVKIPLLNLEFDVILELIQELREEEGLDILDDYLKPLGTDSDAFEIFLKTWKSTLEKDAKDLTEKEKEIVDLVKNQSEFVKTVNKYSNAVKGIEEGDVVPQAEQLLSKYDRFITNQLKIIDAEGYSTYTGVALVNQLNQMIQEVEKDNLLLKSVPDMHPYLNALYKKLDIDKKEVELDRRFVTMMSNKLLRIKEQLEYLKRIAESNTQTLEAEDRNFAGQLFKEKYDLLLEVVSKSNKLKEEVAKLDLTELVSLDGTGMSKEDLPKVYKQLSDLESTVFNIANSDKATLDVLEEYLFNDLGINASSQVVQFEKEMIPGKPMPAIMKFDYLASVMSADMSEFYSELKRFIEDKGIAPLYKQESILKQTYAFLKSGNTYHADARSPFRKIKNSNAYLHGQEAFFLQSSHGGGKTSIMLDFIAQVSDSTVATAPYARMVNNIANSKDPSIISTFDDVSSTISYLGAPEVPFSSFDRNNESVSGFASLGKNVDAELYKKEKEIRDGYAKGKYKNLNTIVVDEITHVDIAQTYLMDRTVALHNKIRRELNMNEIRLIYMGDPNQTGFEVDALSYNITRGFITQSSFVSDLSLRSAYKPYRDITVMMRNEMPLANSNPSGYRIKEGSVPLEYFEENNKGILNGSPSQNLQAIQKAVEMGMITESNRMLVIADSPDQVPDLGIDSSLYDIVAPAQNAQGSEASVVYLLATPEAENNIQALKFYNTHINRGINLTLLRTDNPIFSNQKIKSGNAPQFSRFRNESGELMTEVLKEIKENKLLALGSIEASVAKERKVVKEGPVKKADPTKKPAINKDIDPKAKEPTVQDLSEQSKDDRLKAVEEKESKQKGFSVDQPDHKPGDVRVYTENQIRNRGQNTLWYDGQMSKFDKNKDIRLYSFGVSRYESALVQSDIFPYRKSSTGANQMITALRKVLLGFPSEGEISNFASDYNISRAKFNIRGRKFNEGDFDSTIWDEHISLTKQEAIELLKKKDLEKGERKSLNARALSPNIGDPFIYIEAVIPPKKSSLADTDLKITFLKFPLLDNYVTNNKGFVDTKKTIAQLMSAEPKAAIQILTERVVKDEEVTIPISNQESKKLIQKPFVGRIMMSGSKNSIEDVAKYSKGKAKVLPIVFTGSINTSLPAEIRALYGKPLLLWTYDRNASPQEMVTQFIKGEIEGIQLGSNKTSVRKSVNKIKEAKADENSIINNLVRAGWSDIDLLIQMGYAVDGGSLNKEDYTKLSKLLLSPRSAHLLNSKLLELADEFSTKPAKGSQSGMLLKKFAYLLKGEGMLNIDAKSSIFVKNSDGSEERLRKLNVMAIFDILADPYRWKDKDIVSKMKLNPKMTDQIIAELDRYFPENNSLFENVGISKEGKLSIGSEQDIVSIIPLSETGNIYTQIGSIEMPQSMIRVKDLSGIISEAEVTERARQAQESMSQAMEDINDDLSQQVADILEDDFEISRIEEVKKKVENHVNDSNLNESRITSFKYDLGLSLNPDQSTTADRLTIEIEDDGRYSIKRDEVVVSEATEKPEVTQETPIVSEEIIDAEVEVVDAKDDPDLSKSQLEEKPKKESILLENNKIRNIYPDGKEEIIENIDGNTTVSLTNVSEKDYLAWVNKVKSLKGMEDFLKFMRNPNIGQNFGRYSDNFNRRLADVIFQNPDNVENILELRKFICVNVK